MRDDTNSRGIIYDTIHFALYVVIAAFMAGYIYGLFTRQVTL